MNRILIHVQTVRRFGETPSQFAQACALGAGAPSDKDDVVLYFFFYMDFNKYKKIFTFQAKEKKLTDEQIKLLLDYAEKLSNENLPIIYDVEHLSLLLGYEIDLLYSISNVPERFYRTFMIPKKNGKNRIINEPYPTLKEIQYWILHNILEKTSPSIFAKAYIPGKQLKENARFHKCQKIVLKFDVSNFFGSISIFDVYKIFRHLGYTKKVSSMLARLCCLDNCLPQGAPTSPYLSNLFAKRLDKRIGIYCINNKLRYSRYSDDITISGDISEDKIPKIKGFVFHVLQDFNLSLNAEKTQVLRKSNRQIVTGIIVNDKLSVGHKNKHKIRQELYFIKKFGLESHISYTKIEKRNYLYHLLGLVNWVLSIEKDNVEFLNYKSFLNEIIIGIYKDNNSDFNQSENL